VCNLLAILASREVSDQVKDELVWPLDVKGSFYIKSFCKLLILREREGGLGIPLRDMNKALKVKWLWRFAREDNTLWKDLLKMKYDVDKLGWWSKKSPNPHGVGCWKSITSELDLFRSLVQFKVGNGSRVLF